MNSVVMGEVRLLAEETSFGASRDRSNQVVE